MRPLVLLLCLLFVIRVSADNPPEFDVAGSEHWFDTGIDLKSGDSIVITATGSMQYAASQPNGPEGLPRSWKDLLRSLPMPDLGRGSLIGRIGDTPASRVFLIGPHREMTVAAGGRLFAGINQESSETGEGSYHVKVEVVATGANKTYTDEQLPKITQHLLERIPVRVSDADGNPGDRTNFLIVGSDAKVQELFQAAGWVLVDRTKTDAIIHGILSSLSKESYTQLPMSDLYLFGRPQDYGYAHAEPFLVVSSRHHLRLWKAGERVDGANLWVGAATHDIGLEKDQRNGKMTHKIDPNVDEEREYVAQTLNETGLVAKMLYVMPSKAIKEARTATGGAFHSDGRTLVLYTIP